MGDERGASNESDLLKQFERDMFGIYTRAKKEAHYTATYYFSMLDEHGGMETARRLVTSDRPSDGFTALWDRGRLDLTVEALVLDPRYRTLFDDEFRNRARERLQEYGYEGVAAGEEVPSPAAGPREGGPAELTAEAEETPPSPREPPPPPPVAAALPSPGWHPDPYGVHRFRWWDGKRWTDFTDENWQPPAGG